MKQWGLPESLRVGDKEWPIRSDFTNGLDCMVVLQADDLDEIDKADCVAKIIFPGWQEIYAAGLADEAVMAAYDFLRCGRPESIAPGPRVMDWEEDSPMIFDAINKRRGTDVRNEKMHWWTFCGLYMEIGESLYSTVITLRQKISKGKKMNKEEHRFVRENPQYFPGMGMEVSDELLKEYTDLLK